MKIVAEFNSNAELVSFISTFGGKISGPVTEVKADRYANSAPKTKVEVIKKVETPIETKIEAVVEIKDAEIVKTDETKTGPVELLFTKEMVRAVFTKLFEEGKQKEAKELTAKFGANNLSELKETDYATIYKEAGGLV